MKVLMLALALNSCPTIKIVNKTKSPINERDNQALSTCKKHCSVYFNDSPCLKIFEKYKEQSYHCICGK